MSRMRLKDGPSRRELDQVTEEVRAEIEALFQRHAIPQADAERLLREALVRLSYQWGRIRNRSWWLVDSIEKAARAMSNFSPEESEDA